MQHVDQTMTCKLENHNHKIFQSKIGPQAKLGEKSQEGGPSTLSHARKSILKLFS